MRVATSRDIAPDFRDMLSKLPLSILNVMESSFAAGMMDRRITPADKAILQSFHEEQVKRMVQP